MAPEPVGAELLCVGSVVADISIQGLERFAEPELEFTSASDVWHEQPTRLLAGGTAANTAIVYAELYGACALAGVVGDDPMGVFIQTAVGARGVKLLGPRGGATATHSIALGRDGRRQAYFFAGSWLDLRAINAAWSGGDLYLSGINLCLQRPLVAAARELAAAARRAGGRVVLDIGQGGRQALTFDEVEGLGEVSDVLIGSEAEFQALRGRPYAELRPRLRERFGGPIVVKRGADGVLLDDSPNDEPQPVPSFAIDPVNVVGAGDAFAAGFLGAWLRGDGVASACRWGNAAGAASAASAEGPQGVRRAAVQDLLGRD